MRPVRIVTNDNFSCYVGFGSGIIKFAFVVWEAGRRCCLESSTRTSSLPGRAWPAFAGLRKAWLRGGAPPREGQLLATHISGPSIGPSTLTSGSTVV